MVQAARMVRRAEPGLRSQNEKWQMTYGNLSLAPLAIVFLTHNRSGGHGVPPRQLAPSLTFAGEQEIVASTLRAEVIVENAVIAFPTLSRCILRLAISHFRIARDTTNAEWLVLGPAICCR
jgi:hypothetical protein